MEGYCDELFVRRCFGALNIPVSTIYGKRGCGYLLERANGFAQRGLFGPILILADLMDMPDQCPVRASAMLVPNPTPRCLVRFAEREIESWILASRPELANYLGVRDVVIPRNPDAVLDPKQELVNLARRSRRSRIKKMFVPRDGSSAQVGPGYVDGFSEFLTGHWRLQSAKTTSQSFSRFVDRITEKFG